MGIHEVGANWLRLVRLYLAVRACTVVYRQHTSKETTGTAQPLFHCRHLLGGLLLCKFILWLHIALSTSWARIAYVPPACKWAADTFKGKHSADICLVGDNWISKENCNQNLFRILAKTKKFPERICRNETDLYHLNRECSAVAEHCELFDHQISPDATVVLEREENHQRWQFLFESWHIQKMSGNNNHSSGTLSAVCSQGLRKVSAHLSKP